MATDLHELRQTLCEAGRRLWERNLVGACEGNLSARLDDGTFLATPSGVSKGHLEPDHLAIVDADGNSVNDIPASSEIGLHMAIYRGRPDCQAVVHAHPPTATAFGLAGKAFRDDLLPESAIVLGSVATVPFSMPGTPEVGAAITPLLDGHKTFILSHHGAVVMGNDLWDAVYRMETLERVAQIIMNAELLGGSIPMPDPAFERLRADWLHGKL